MSSLLDRACDDLRDLLVREQADRARRLRPLDETPIVDQVASWRERAGTADLLAGSV